jgi:hypothetical protein
MRCDPAPFDTQGGWIDHVVFHSGMTFSAAPALNFAEGAPKTDNWRREAWLVDVLTGDPTRDEVLLGTHLNRLRKTYLPGRRGRAQPAGGSGQRRAGRGPDVRTGAAGVPALLLRRASPCQSGRKLTSKRGRHLRRAKASDHLAGQPCLHASRKLNCAN